MTDEREAPGRKGVATDYKSELIRRATTASMLALRDALWEGLDGIEEKAPGAPIECELMILDRVAERFGNTRSERDSKA
jgi:hypothetical protein